MCTICQNLEILYRKAVTDDRLGEVLIIKECYVMAKKMNHKLIWYKHGGEIPSAESLDYNKSEEDWLKELDRVLEKGFIWKNFKKA